MTRSGFKSFRSLSMDIAMSVDGKEIPVKANVHSGDLPILLTILAHLLSKHTLPPTYKNTSDSDNDFHHP